MPDRPLEYVSTRQQLTPLIAALERAGEVAMDTEFIGEGTYEPYLCLIQIATEEGIWIVDPLAVADLHGLWKVMTDPARELVVLAAREELRFCLRYAGRIPERLMDVQIAAGLVGCGYPLSHTNLVRKVLGVQLSGSETFTDWRKRPLTARQIEYAADDVRYLLAVRRSLLDEARNLHAPGGGEDRIHWIEAECRRSAERIVAAEQEERWWKVPGSTNMNRRELAVLRELWRWRDQQARDENIPPRRVMKDELLTEVARRKPATQASLYELRGMDRGSVRHLGGQIVGAVQRALQLPDTELPASLRRDDPPQLGLLTQILALAANNLAAEHKVDPALLATNADLQEVVRWCLSRTEAEEPFVFTGWRGAILREPLTEILSGQRHLRVANIRSESPLSFER